MARAFFEVGQILFGHAAAVVTTTKGATEKVIEEVFKSDPGKKYTSILETLKGS